MQVEPVRWQLGANRRPRVKAGGQVKDAGGARDHESTNVHKLVVGAREGAAAFKGAVKRAEKVSMKTVSGLHAKLLLVAFVIATRSIAMFHFSDWIEVLGACSAIPEAGDNIYNHPRYFWACLWSMSEACLGAQVKDLPSLARNNSASADKPQVMVVWLS
eukprot:CAMPEP_0119115770 /NCGR_PEP_ID=MMETSP1180-20130426/51921_1 /TAXON_ID=3052 ORGANISM="Chlamydomonas cf sp, Strain CCMP681" /NCGR_SAMPLE_ID=MMETSP1180 /ASSEMBLY_ACC=CAM_ASM_000741 /LENGTH=159 /DNA_ID=CAMNT_0007104861 /DNA_START=363 /DNA_END=842 /DNA_ORIENTATION=+